MPPPSYPAIGRRSLSSKPVFHVLARIDGPGAPWKTVLRTADRQYALARIEQYREAGVEARLQKLGDD